MLIGENYIKLVLGMLMALLTICSVHAGDDRGAGVVATNAIQPHLAIDDDGDTYVVFIHEGNICVSVSRDEGKHFSDPIVAMDVNGRARGGMQRGPRIGVDAEKNLTVTAPVTFDDAEYEKKYPTADLYLTQSSDGGKIWSPPQRINEVPKKAPEALHWMAVAPNGGVHVAWLDLRSRQERGQDIYYAQVNDGKIGDNYQIATTVCECCAPGLAVDGNGNPLVAFREGGEKPSREIYAVHSQDRGRTFSRRVQINSVDSQEHG